jgi:hypothetical protein
VEPTDTPEALARRVQEGERALVVAVLVDIADGRTHGAWELRAQR